LAEAALRQLRDSFPGNVDPAQVLLKVIALSRLYSARVLDKKAQRLSFENGGGAVPIIKRLQ
jgi:hypothetical protein